MEESKRIRVVFKDESILSENQKSYGLSRSWVLLKPHQHDTVSDVALHILHAFQLHQSCPHGLILSTSGFVLPPFESANILKDYEIVRVQKRKDILSIAGNNTANDVEKLKAVEKQPVNNGLLLLANEEFEKEKGGYESDEHEAENEEALLENVEHPSSSKRNRKRKSADKLQHFKQKKQRPDATVKTSNNVGTDKSQGFHKDAEFRKKKSVSSEGKKDDSVAGDSAKNNGEQRNDEVQENSNMAEDAKIAPEETKKVPSRSARRTYAKRKWLREMAKIQKQNANCESEGLRNWKEDKAKSGRIEVDSQVKGLRKWKKHQADVEGKLADTQPKGLLHWTPQDNWIVKDKKRKQRSQNDPIPPSQNDDKDEQQIQAGYGHEQSNQAQGDSLEQPGQKKAAAQESKNQSCDASDILNQESGEENEVVPIEIRPGHIRFEPLGKEQPVQKDHFPQKTFHWNGITSKKKGQQWGKEDSPIIPRNDHKIRNEEVYKEETHEDEGTNLDKLCPLLGMPKKGDIIAYRVLELSSSWTPEISAYRVGRVSWYNSDSNQIMLLPVPGYPVVLKKADEDEAAQLDNSLYKEDDSLEIDFSSLIDVRIFNNGRSEPGNDSLNSMSECPAGDVNVPKTALLSSSDEPTILPSQDATGSNQAKETESPTAENVGVDIWDLLSETLNAKKEQLSKENGWGSSPPLKVRVHQENTRGSTPKKVQDNNGGKKPYPGGKWVKRAQPSQENSLSSGSKSWSHRTLRGSALGPTMAMLRSNKD